MAYGRRSILCTLTEWLEKKFSEQNNSPQNKYPTENHEDTNLSIYLANKLASQAEKKGKTIDTRELGEKYCFLVFDKTSEFFNDEQLMKDLGIDKTNDSVSEITILNMFSVACCIMKYGRLGSDIRHSIIDNIIDPYVEFLFQHSQEKGVDEDALLKAVDKFHELIASRFAQYNEILNNYGVSVIKNGETNGIEGIDAGDALINVLQNITCHKHDGRDVFASLYFFNYFIHLIMDEHINDTIKSDFDKYDIIMSE